MGRGKGEEKVAEEWGREKGKDLVEIKKGGMV